MKRIFRTTTVLLALLFLGHSAFGQKADSLKKVLQISGSINANNNGFSFVPTFSLGKPAVQTGFGISREKGRLSAHPQFWYSMLDYKPWSFIFIWRYKLIRQKKFELAVGTHAPAINFRSATIDVGGVPTAVIKARRFYPALEILPVYRIKKNVSLGMYFLFGTGIEKEVSSKNFFVSLRPDFNHVRLSRQLFMRFNPQFYYLKIDAKDGFYAAANLTLAHQKWPFSIGAMFNKIIQSEIDTKDFVWNVGLTWAFAKRFLEK